MTTVTTSGKIVTSIMTLQLLESTELDYIDFWCIYRGGSRILGKGVHMLKEAGFAFLILSHFSQISHENEIIWPHRGQFHRIFEN